jgi:hypothetical protein
VHIEGITTVTRQAWQRAGDGLLAAALFGASLALYSQTLAPSVASLFDDSLELPLVAYRLAIAHPTGYPLYTLLSKLLSLGPWHNVAWAVNLLSAVAAALAVALVYGIVRQLARRRLPALLGAVALTVSPVFWSQSVDAEVYSLNAALVAGLLWLALRWARRPMLPVKPFSLLLIEPERRRPLFLPAERWWLRPKGVAMTFRIPPKASPEQSKGACPEHNEEACSKPREEARPEQSEGDYSEQSEGACSEQSEGACTEQSEEVQKDRLESLSHSVKQNNMPGWAPRGMKAGRTPVRPYNDVFRRMPLTGRRAAWRLRRLYRRFFPAVPPRRRLQPHPWLLGLAALYGLGLAHHRTIVLLAPALLLFVWLVERRTFSRAALLGPEHPDRPRWRQIVGRPGVLLALCLLGPLLLYLYLPLRGQVGSLDDTYVNSWHGFWQWVTASSYNAFLGQNPLARNLDASFYGGLFWQQFGPAGLALALLGLLALFRQPKALVLTGLAFAAYVAFAVAYRVPDVEVFYIPAFLLASVWIGVGLDYAADLLRLRSRSLAWRRVLAVSSLLVFLAAIGQPLFLAARNYPGLDLSRQWIVHDYGQYALEQDLPHGNSTIVGLLGEMTLLRYFQDTTGLRRDVRTIVADDEEARLRTVETELAAGRAVFITRPLPGLSDTYGLDASIGLIDLDDDMETLIRVGPPDFQVPELPNPIEGVQSGGVQLLGYELFEHQAHWQAWLRLRLWWQAARDGGRPAPFKVSARLLDAHDHVVAATDAEPVSAAYPATSWRPGEVVADAYEIPLSAGLPPGEYTPLIIVYEPTTGIEQARTTLPPTHLQGNPARPPRRALEASVSHTPYARFGDLELLGTVPVDPAAIYRPGQELPLTLLWQGHGTPVGDLRVTFWLEAIQQQDLGQKPVGGLFPTNLWAENQVVRQWPVLRVPDGTPPGTYHLKLRVTRDGQPAPWGWWLIPLGSDLDLGPVQVGF